MTTTRQNPATNASTTHASPLLTKGQALLIFASFALAYFLSNVVRAITATLAPTLSREFSLTAGDLGLLAGGYFLGFACMQLPMGIWLDRFGPKRVLLTFLMAAMLGCAAFAFASGLVQLWLARVCIGVGVSACLMAPMTAYRLLFTPAMQLRTHSWMLMVGALGMVASTLPVQWALGVLGWRGIFWVLLALCVLAWLAVWLGVPKVGGAQSAQTTQSAGSPISLSNRAGASEQGYVFIAKDKYFQRLAPIAFFMYGGVGAIQTLWAGPWLVNVVGLSADQAAQGLFGMNVVMLFTFLGWGWILPKLTASGKSVNWLLTWVLPSLFVVLALIVWWPQQASWWALTLLLVTASAGALAQSALGASFPTHLAGRALSLYNLMIFAGMFFMQWGFGLCVDVFIHAGATLPNAYRGAMLVYAVLALLSYLWFLWWTDHKPLPSTKSI